MGKGVVQCKFIPYIIEYALEKRHERKETSMGHIAED
tara:strand:+ start:1429 stop:1539 length:111 start_codon:yes stop_codon:yes gene_type:complete